MTASYLRGYALAACALGALVSLTTANAHDEVPSAPSRTPDAPTADALFVANEGQLPPSVLYYALVPGGRLEVGVGHVEYVQAVGPAPVAAESRRHGPAEVAVVRAVAPDGTARYVPAPREGVRETRRAVEPEGARLGVPVVGEAAPTRVSILRGPRAAWHTNLRTYRTVTYEGAWPGTDLVLRVSGHGLAYARVPAGARPATLPMAPAGTGPLQAPALTYGSYFGQSQDDRGLGVAVDGSGRAYLTGQGSSTGTGDDDAFVARFSPDGTELDYVTYFGGSDFDAGFDITVDGEGYAYVAGMTQSNTSSFPVVGGPDRTYNGNGDVLVAKLTPDGADFAFAGFFGGDGLDFAEGVAVDAEGHTYLTGVVGSLQGTFPVAVGPDTTFNGNPTPDQPDLDAFVAKLVPEPNSAQVGRNVVYAGYIGGRQYDVGVFEDGTGTFITAGHVALGADGSAYLSGMTQSDQTSFPDGNGIGPLTSPDRTHGGDWDAWVAKVAADGKGLEYAGFLGGNRLDEGFGMAVDAAGQATFTGYTESSETTLGVKVGPDLVYGGKGDAFVAQVAADGTGFNYAGYLGGARTDGGYALAGAPDGSVYVAGYAESLGDDFPAVGGPDLTQNDPQEGIGDAFVCHLRAVPDAPVAADNYASCGYIGGRRYDQAFWIVLDAAGNAYVVGDTESDETSFPDGDGWGSIPGAEQVHAGRTDAFIVRMGTGDVPEPTATQTVPVPTATETGPAPTAPSPSVEPPELTGTPSASPTTTVRPPDVTPRASPTAGTPSPTATTQPGGATLYLPRTYLERASTH